MKKKNVKKSEVNELAMIKAENLELRNTVLSLKNLVTQLTNERAAGVKSMVGNMHFIEDQSKIIKSLEKENARLTKLVSDDDEIFKAKSLMIDHLRAAVITTTNDQMDTAEALCRTQAKIMHAQDVGGCGCSCEH
jgi:hypothetical protein